jgi:methionyl-tRNA formyltransferase
MELGAKTVLKTVQLIENNEVKPIPQHSMVQGELKTAHKIFKDDCLIDWGGNALSIHNFIRGLSPFPTAFSNLILETGEKILFKIYNANFEIKQHQMAIGAVETDRKNYLKVACKDGFITLIQVQMAGKKAMSVVEFLRGFDMSKLKQMGA